jgi:hypothetical protein
VRSRRQRLDRTDRFAEFDTSRRNPWRLKEPIPRRERNRNRTVKDLTRTFSPETDFTHITPQQDTALATLVIRNCLGSRESAQIVYVEPSQPSSSRNPADALPARVRANRNDPCPCGSGKKYKSCCGKR